MERYFILVTLGTLVLMAAEILAGRHKSVYKKGDFLLLAGCLVGRGLVAPAATILVMGFWALLLPQYKGALHNAPFWLAFPLLLMLSEFCFYWVHRWSHTNAAARLPVLWKIHRTHHSGRHMNTSLLFRLNPFWYFIIPAAWVGGLAIQLGLGTSAAAVSLVLMGWNAITHSNFRWDDAIRQHRLFGPLFNAAEHIIVSPGIHHTHHGYGRDGASYRNFAIVLSFYDWVFGTLHIPSGRPFRYGLPGEDAHWVEQLLYPLVRAKPSRAQTSARKDVGATP